MTTQDIPESAMAVIGDATTEMAFHTGMRGRGEHWDDRETAIQLTTYVLEFVRAQEAAPVAYGTDQLSRPTAAVNARRNLLMLAGMAMTLAEEIDAEQLPGVRDLAAPRGALVVAALQQIATHGLGWVCDMNPTQPAGGWDAYGWQRYMTDNSEHLKEKAQAVLDGKFDPTRRK